MEKDGGGGGGGHGVDRQGRGRVVRSSANFFCIRDRGERALERRPEPAAGFWSVRVGGYAQLQARRQHGSGARHSTPVHDASRRAMGGGETGKGSGQGCSTLPPPSLIVPCCPPPSAVRCSAPPAPLNPSWRQELSSGSINACPPPPPPMLFAEDPATACVAPSSLQDTMGRGRRCLCDGGASRTLNSVRSASLFAFLVCVSVLHCSKSARCVRVCVCVYVFSDARGRAP